MRVGVTKVWCRSYRLADIKMRHFWLDENVFWNVRCVNVMYDFSVSIWMNWYSSLFINAIFSFMAVSFRKGFNIPVYIEIFSESSNIFYLVFFFLIIYSNVAFWNQTIHMPNIFYSEAIFQFTSAVSDVLCVWFLLCTCLCVKFRL